jgi:outer membrane protein OmpA-like peptidoglycan-associated protein
MPTDVRTLAWLVVLPVLALAPAFADSPTRQAAPAAATPPPMVASAAVVSALDFGANDLLPPIHFAAGTTQIRPSDTKILDAHAVWLRRDRKRVLLIEGHTDGSGETARSAERLVNSAPSLPRPIWCQRGRSRIA